MVGSCFPCMHFSAQVGFEREYSPVVDPGFSQGGANPRIGGAGIKFNPPQKNCMKLRTFWPLGGGRALGVPPLDPPLLQIKQAHVLSTPTQNRLKINWK